MTPAPSLILFDLDGTLALTGHRDHFITKPRKEWNAFFAACKDDAPNLPVITAFQALKAQGHRLEIWTGRIETVYAETLVWLEQHGIAPHAIKMRAKDDFTPDHLLKEEWLQNAEQKPFLVFEDRDRVVDMWRRHNIPCFQVAAWKHV